MRRFLFAIGLVVGSLSPVAPAMAQPGCGDVPTWPSFVELAPTARSIVLVQVIESHEGIAHKARSVDVMKGSSQARVDLRRLRPGRPQQCPRSKALYAQVGDRLAVAFEGRASDRPDRVDAVAHVGRMRDHRNLSGLERLTIDEARAYDVPVAVDELPSPMSIAHRSRGDFLSAVYRLASATYWPVRSAARPTRPTPSLPAEPPVAVPADVLWSCEGAPPGFPRSVLDGPPGAEKMEGAVYNGLRSALKTMRSEFMFERRGDRPHRLPWLLALRDAGKALFLVRRKGDREHYSVMYVERRGGTWGFAGYADPCHLRPVSSHGLGESDWRIDTASSPTAASSSFAVEVHEQACASGRTAEGRIADPIVEYAEDAITITIPVRRVEADSVTCQGNPWTPFVIELNEPIGERLLLDGGPWPPQQRWPIP